MEGYLRQSTASQTRSIGPFVSDTDFKTVQNGLTIANTDVKLKKNGGASASKNSGGATADGTDGLYHLTWDATDTATVGELKYAVLISGALIVFGTYMVVEEAVYDALYAANAPGYVVDQPVNVTKFGGTTVTARDIGASVLLSPGTGTGQIDLTSGIPKANVTQFNGAAATSASGRPEVNTTHIAGTISPAVAGSVAIDWAQVSNKTTVNALTNTSIASVSGAVGSVTGAVGSVTGAVGSVTGAVGSVTGAVGSVTGNVGGNVVGSAASVTGAVGSVTGAVGSVTGNVGGNVTGSIGTITNTGIDGILDRSAGVETNFTLRQAMRLMLSSVVAKLSGAATTSVVIRDINDTKNRITATCDASGNRTAVVTDVT